MGYHTKRYCDKAVGDAVDKLEDGKKRLNRYLTRLDKPNLNYRDLDLFGSKYTTEITDAVKAAKNEVQTVIDELEAINFTEAPNE